MQPGRLHHPTDRRSTAGPPSLSPLLCPIPPDMSLPPPPTHHSCRLALEWGLLTCTGRLPEASLASALCGDIKRHGRSSQFVRWVGGWGAAFFPCAGRVKPGGTSFEGHRAPQCTLSYYPATHLACRPQEGMFGLREWAGQGHTVLGTSHNPNGTSSSCGVASTSTAGMVAASACASGGIAVPPSAAAPTQLSGQAMVSQAAKRANPEPPAASKATGRVSMAQRVQAARIHSAMPLLQPPMKHDCAMGS